MIRLNVLIAAVVVTMIAPVLTQAGDAASGNSGRRELSLRVLPPVSEPAEPPCCRAWWRCNHVNARRGA